MTLWLNLAAVSFPKIVVSYLFGRQQ